MSVLAIRARRWSRVEYERLIAHGLFRPGERLELIGGELLVREPQGDRHALAMELVGDALRGALGPGWRVRVQLPVALADDSEPEPDFSIVRGVPRRITGRSIPSRPALIVEVADSSVRFDRRQKGSLYARAGVADYWILNLGTRVLEVRRQPEVSIAAPYGWDYHEVRTLDPASTVSPIAVPGARIRVADLLP
jgi:Uma2 family endonuclease